MTLAYSPLMATSIAQLEELSAPALTAQRGEAVYLDQLHALLEPECNGQIVAIHLPTQEYFLGRTLLEAADRLRQRHPDARRGETYARAVGSRAAAIRAHSPRVKGISQ